MRSLTRFWWILIASVCLTALGLPLAAQTNCTGDCGDDGAVTVDEIILLVNIALGELPVQSCSGGDANGDGVISVDEIIAAVSNLLQGCPQTPTPPSMGTPSPTSTEATLQTPSSIPTSTPTATASQTGTATPPDTSTPTPTSTLPPNTATPSTTPVATEILSGTCLRPGASGLEACPAGTAVNAYRCDDRASCLGTLDPARLLATGEVIGSNGGFSLVADATRVAVPLLFTADVEEAVIYRLLSFGSIGAQGGGGSLAAAAMSDAIIDPTSEGSVRTINRAGVQNVADIEPPVLLSTARAQNPDYAGMSAETAAENGTSIASAVFFPQRCPVQTSGLTVPNTAADGPGISCEPDVTLAFQRGPDPLIGAMSRVQLTLGAPLIDGGTTLTVDKVSLGLDCTDSFLSGCIDDGDVVEYLGDQTIETTCGVSWTSNLPSGGTNPNTVEFTPIGPLQIPAGALQFCTLSVGVRVVDVSHDATPFLFFQNAEMNGVCDNGLVGMSRFVQATGIPFHECPPTPTATLGPPPPMTPPNTPTPLPTPA